MTLRSLLRSAPRLGRHDALQRQPTLRRGPELAPNGTFAVDVAGWTSNQASGLLSWVGGRLVMTNSSAGVLDCRAYAPIACAIGSTYEVVAEVQQPGGLGINFACGNGAGFTTIASTTLAAAITPKQHRFIFVAQQLTQYIFAGCALDPAAAYQLDNVSVKQLLP